MNEYLIWKIREIYQLTFFIFFSEVTGVIIRIEPIRRSRTNAGGQPFRLLRTVMSNMEGRQWRLLLWGDEADRYEGQIYRQSIRITRPRITHANPQYTNPADNLMPIEMSVQRHSTVEILGPYEIPAAVNDRPEYRLIPLENAGRVTGLVRIEAFIRMRIEQQYLNNAGIGSGAITDGEYRLAVHVSLFDVNQSPAVGAHVAIEGELRRNNQNALFLQVVDMSRITIIDDRVLDEFARRRGFRIPPADDNYRQNAVHAFHGVNVPLAAGPENFNVVQPPQDLNVPAVPVDEDNRPIQQQLPNVSSPVVSDSGNNGAVPRIRSDVVLPFRPSTSQFEVSAHRGDQQPNGSRGSSQQNSPEATGTNRPIRKPLTRPSVLLNYDSDEELSPSGSLLNSQASAAASAASKPAKAIADEAHQPPIGLDAYRQLLGVKDGTRKKGKRDEEVSDTRAKKRAKSDQAIVIQDSDESPDESD